MSMEAARSMETREVGSQDILPVHLLSPTVGGGEARRTRTRCIGQPGGPREHAPANLAQSAQPTNMTQSMQRTSGTSSRTGPPVIAI